MNIVGKRSGKGFVAHKAKLVSALSRALADRVMLMGLTIGRKGFLGYLKALGGSNVIKVIPDSSASGSQATGEKLKVLCGANTSYLAELEWIGEKTPLTMCEVRVSPSNSVKPNVGASELAEALNRVLPFVSKEDNKPVLACVNLIAKEGKLTLVSADGYTLAIVSLDFDDGEGQALINAGELRGVANALRRAKRARVSFDGEEIKTLTIDTELIRYKWVSVDGKFPDYEKLIPTDFNCLAHFDTIEAIKAVSSLSALSPKATKDYTPAIDLTIGNGKVVMANPDDKGQAELTADTDGEVKIRVDGRYLAQVLRACGGMVEFKLTNAYSPMLFSHNGYRVVVMPVMTNESNEQAKKAREAKAEAEKQAEQQPTEQQPTKPVAVKKPKVAVKP
ncbi:hypothetical protein ES703_12828 [subsurface metagenome]